MHTGGLYKTLLFINVWYVKTFLFYIIRPNKKISVFPVSWLTLFFLRRFANPSIFSAKIWNSRVSRISFWHFHTWITLGFANIYPNNQVVILRSLRFLHWHWNRYGEGLCQCCNLWFLIRSGDKNNLLEIFSVPRFCIQY